MRIPGQFIKSVTFLSVDDQGERKPKATAFFSGAAVNNLNFYYAVTTLHNIDSARKYGKLYLRISTKNGSYRDLKSDPDDWIHSTSSDVAILRVQILPDDDLQAVPDSMIATDEYISRHRVGPGDDVFFIGLFSQRPGEERPEPITRFGNICLIPSSEVRIETAAGEKTVRAYLVEARSLGGHSGSPVFICYGADRDIGMLTVGGRNPALLGLVHGHYDVRGEDFLTGDVEDSQIMGRINAAVIVVMPGQEIINLLHQEELKRERNKIVEDYVKRVTTPTPD